MNLERRSFIKGSALLAAMSAVGGVRAAGIVNHEQKYHDRCTRPNFRCRKSCSIRSRCYNARHRIRWRAFAVSDFALGYAEVGRQREDGERGAVPCEGVPLRMLDDRVMRIRMTGLSREQSTGIVSVRPHSPSPSATGRSLRRRSGRRSTPSPHAAKMRRLTSR